MNSTTQSQAERSTPLSGGPEEAAAHKCLPRQGAGLHLTAWLVTLAIGAGATALQAGESDHPHEHGRGHGPRVARKAEAATAATNAALVPAKFDLPPLPSGVSELKFSDFFVRPVGARGLELTEKLRQLGGKRVRILGYMVHQEEPPNGRFLFTPMPAQIHEHDNGLADDLPASTLYVSVPSLRAEEVPYLPGLMLLTGTLSVGNQAEPDGRISVARLVLDPSEASAPLPSLPSSGNTLSTPSETGAKRLSSNVNRLANAAP